MHYSLRIVSVALARMGHGVGEPRRGDGGGVTYDTSWKDFCTAAWGKGGPHHELWHLELDIVREYGLIESMVLSAMRNDLVSGRIVRGRVTVARRWVKIAFERHNVQKTVEGRMSLGRDCGPGCDGYLRKLL